jgi:hypothetical protein
VVPLENKHKNTKPKGDKKKLGRRVGDPIK